MFDKDKMLINTSRWFDILDLWVNGTINTQFKTNPRLMDREKMTSQLSNISIFISET